ncbi:MAG: hypothetical protein AAGN35_25150 [Bacteroidota bacterium]
MKRKPAPEAEPPQIETPAEETEAPKPKKRARPIMKRKPPPTDDSNPDQ